MKNLGTFLNIYKQNKELPIRLISPTFGHLPLTTLAEYGLTHRKPYYFFLFMLEGNSTQTVDLQQFEVTDNELLFILPHQIHQLPATHGGNAYFKLAFDEHTLSLLPKQYSFLINPLNNQKTGFTPSAAARLTAIFEMMQNLLGSMDTDAELILAHLNSLLAEISAAYFGNGKKPADGKLSTYIQFKLLVEANLTDHTSVNEIAEKLAVNTNSLYSIVKNYSGLSPKEFITNRLILEAKRRLYYAESTSIKELSYDLGFNDPEYFSRLFKKQTGKTISSFLQDLSRN
jgi:AraC-like DNA-binding protein